MDSLVVNDSSGGVGTHVVLDVLAVLDVVAVPADKVLVQGRQSEEAIALALRVVALLDHVDVVGLGVERDHCEEVNVVLEALGMHPAGSGVLVAHVLV